MLAFAAAAFATVPMLSSCGLAPASDFIPSIKPGSIKPMPGLKGVKLKVTSKDFTEQILLGKISVMALKAAGADVEDDTDVQGSNNARAAVVRGEYDVMWDYTGTAWITYLGKSNPIPDSHRQYEAVRKLDLKRNHIVWMKPGLFNNTYALAITRKTERKYHLKDLSDITKVPKAKRTFCVESEFFSRNDGFPGMLKKYHIKYGSDIPSANIKKMSTGVVYNATARGTCTFGEVFTTDGRIQALHLKTLSDNKHFFPLYNPSASVREPLVKAHPQLRQVFAQISPKLTQNTMRKLNADVDVYGQDPTEVAKKWMIKEGFIK